MVQTVDRKLVSSWAEELEAVNERLSAHFARSEVRGRAQDYLRGLLSEAKRKNGWQLAEVAGNATPYGIQHLLGRANWDADAVRDDLREYVLEHLAGGESVLVIDETGFLKKGDKSVGVKRQYTGTAGKRENCQVGVFLAYASCRGQAFIDRELYLPEEWTGDEERRERAGVPEEVGMRTKPELAKEMLKRALDAGVNASWVLADSLYGDTRRLGMLLEERGQPYVLAVSGKAYVWAGLRQSTGSAKCSRSSGKESLSLKMSGNRASSASRPGTARRGRASTTGRGSRSIRPCRKASRDGFWCAAVSRIRRNSAPTRSSPPRAPRSTRSRRPRAAAGEWRSDSRRPRGRSVWPTTRSEAGTDGTATSPSPSSPTPSSPPSDRPVSKFRKHHKKGAAKAPQASRSSRESGDSRAIDGGRDSQALVSIGAQKAASALGGSNLVVLMASPPSSRGQTVPLQAERRAAGMICNCSISDPFKTLHER
jgi:hypothetical protein